MNSSPKHLTRYFTWIDSSRINDGYEIKECVEKRKLSRFQKTCDTFYTISVKELVLSYKILLSCLMGK
jgi:hypothetical protein